MCIFSAFYKARKKKKNSLVLSTNLPPGVTSKFKGGMALPLVQALLLMVKESKIYKAQP